MSKRGPRPTPPEVRFFRFVDKGDECWTWTGARQAGGYGRFASSASVLVLAHRWSYEHHVGPIADGLTIDHLCRNTSCVNPDHLEPVTREVNAWRGNPHKDRTHCDAGHELTEANVYIAPSRPTVRLCRECRKAASAARHLSTKVAS
jgi:hypothetical protein